MNNEPTIQDFLKSIQSILQKNEEISKLRQENFNVFSILRKESDEEHLHSAFLAELLDCNGSHDMGSIFLKLFIERFCKEKFKELFDRQNVQTYKEKYLEGYGRADIYIESNSFILLIENKIWAGDGEQQLWKYHRYLQKKDKQFVLFYLTLWGNEASKDSTNDKIKAEKDYFCLSYKEDIIDWLQDCMKEATNVPTVRETIKQYINLIKKLTGQLTNQEMEKEIIQHIINNYNNYEVAKTIQANFGKAKLELINRFLDKIIEKVKKELPEKEWEISKSKDLSQTYRGMYVSHKEWDTSKNKVCLVLEGQPSIKYNVSAFGIVAHKNHYNREEIKELLKSELEKGYPEESEGWPFYHLKYNFGNTEQEKQIFKDTEKFAQEIADEFITLARICEKKLKELKPIS